MTSDIYDALTLEVERADVLAQHLADKLSDFSDVAVIGRELYALALVAESIRAQHARILEKAQALVDSGGLR